ncbi:MAG: FAD-dependent oxidoreductase [Lachnospiraceae bacterium]|nr:FAD-dependent oxidoreductase [Lachnospiraceae bacterium]
MSERFVILGNGIAGFSAAQAIRERSETDEIVMISEEREMTYSRPRLSKTGVKSLQREKLLVVPEGWYEEQRIELVLGKRIVGLDAEQRKVTLEDGAEVLYDTCIYALGARPFVPPIPGAEQPHVLTVRSYEDFEQIRRRLALAEHAVVIGGGVIGLELAWELAQTGCPVSVLELAPWLLGRQLDRQSSELLEQAVRAQGIEVLTGVQVEAIEVQQVNLSEGVALPADLVLLCCGIRANVDLAQKAGLACDKGVLVDASLRTSDTHVYAAGDCIQLAKVGAEANQKTHPHPMQNPGLWNYARRSGEIAGCHGCGKRFVPKTEPVILNACGISLFAMGSVEEGPEVETVVAAAGRAGQKKQPVQFLVNQQNGTKLHYDKRFYRDGHLCGAVLIGDLSAMKEIKNLLQSAERDPAGEGEDEHDGQTLYN